MFKRVKFKLKKICIFVSSYLLEYKLCFLNKYLRMLVIPCFDNFPSFKKSDMISFLLRVTFLKISYLRYIVTESWQRRFIVLTFLLLSYWKLMDQHTHITDLRMAVFSLCLIYLKVFFWLLFCIFYFRRSFL